MKLLRANIGNKRAHSGSQVLSLQETMRESMPIQGCPLLLPATNHWTEVSNASCNLRVKLQDG
jgi:hypothetical protein